jgi:hypothetical protein
MYVRGVGPALGALKAMRGPGVLCAASERSATYAQNLTISL